MNATSHAALMEAIPAAAPWAPVPSSPALQLDDNGQGRGDKRATKARWSRQRAQRLERSCYLYLFVHQQKDRFKIGLSVEPFHRLSQLDEAQQIDLSRSLVVQLGSVKRAYEMEGMLHKALSPHRIQPSRKRHSGDTEWFELPALALATQLILNTPCSAQAIGYLLQSLSDHVASTASAGGLDAKTADPTRLLSLNLKVAQSVSQMLMQVAQETPVVVCANDGKAKAHPTVVVRHFKRFGVETHLPSKTRASGCLLSEYGRHQLRMKVIDLESYQLAGRRSCPRTHTWLAPDSLVHSISYGAGKAIGDVVAAPDDLVIRFASAHALHALPAGEQLSKAVDVLVSQLSLMTLMNQRAKAHERGWHTPHPFVQPATSAIAPPRPPLNALITPAH